jgi:hypothetical protein
VRALEQAFNRHARPVSETVREPAPD